MFVGKSEDPDKYIESSNYYRQAVFDCQIVCLWTFSVHIDGHQPPLWHLVEGEVTVTDWKWNGDLRER
jgi:hypothetical protein